MSKDQEKKKGPPPKKKQTRIKKVKVRKNRPTPFDLKKMVASISGQEFLSGGDLRKALAPLIVKHRRKLPADFFVDDLVKRLRENGWLQTKSDEVMAFQVPGVNPRRTSVGKKVIGYEHPQSNDATLRKVYALNKAEQKRKGVVATLRYVIAAGDRAEQKLHALRAKCDHRVFDDAPEPGPGGKYERRACLICDATIHVLERGAPHV
jgi:hypothetical protein